MNLLLDTHAFVWAVLSPGFVGKSARQLIASPKAKVFVSAASLYEMSLKAQLGKWPEAVPILVDLNAIVEETGYNLLPVSPEHALYAGRLTTTHRDPFDRLIAATALQEHYSLCSADSALDVFGVRRIW